MERFWGEAGLFHCATPGMLSNLTKANFLLCKMRDGEGNMICPSIVMKSK